MIAQVTNLGVAIGSDQAIAAARATIERECCLHIPGFLSPDLLLRMQRAIAGVAWETRVHRLVEPPPVDLVMRDHAVEGRLHFLVNDPALFRLVETLFACGPIGCFLGTVYQMVPGQGHTDSWHHDVTGSRLVTLSVNLSQAPFEGGTLQIMDWESKRVIHEAANTGPGDAILFPIGMQWRHRVTEMRGTRPKVALAGWFERFPIYAERIPRRPAAGPTSPHLGPRM